MPKRKIEFIEHPTAGLSLDDLLAAEEQQERAYQKRRHQELRPAIPSISPTPGIVDPALTNGNGEDDEPPGTRALKGNRKELATSKRAKQNRDAQRAFRERKAGHIQELEDKVNRLQAVSTAHKQLQIENVHLRHYVATLQRTLISSDIEVPETPVGLNISRSPDSTTAESQGYSMYSNMRYERATSAEVMAISNEAMRADAHRKQLEDERSRQEREVVVQTIEANIEPTLLEESARQAEPQAA